MIIDTDKTIVVQWYSKENLENAFDMELTQEKFDAFRQWLWESIATDFIDSYIEDEFIAFNKTYKRRGNK